MNRHKIDKLDAYRLKAAETEQERLQVMEEAITRAVEKSQASYLVLSLAVAVTLVLIVQILVIMELVILPQEVYPWCITAMTFLILVPWQMRRLRAFR